MTEKLGRRRRPGKGGAEVLNGETALRDVETITLTLEDGRKAAFNIAAELAIPTDPDEMRQAAIDAPSRYAFWSYQTERALSALRKMEKREREMVGYKTMEWWTYYQEYTAEYASRDVVAARVDTETDVQSARIRLNSLRREYGMLRAVRDSLDHRTRMLHKLVLVTANPG